jgi:osmoprotectant transport system permease protein
MGFTARRNSGGLMDTLRGMFDYLFTAENWTTSGGIFDRLWEHVVISGSSVVAASLLAVGVGLYVGHARRFEFTAVNIANLGRALPSFAILAIMFPLALRLDIDFEFWPTFVALFLLAIPPILTNTYVGVKGVDQDGIEAARGMGMTGRQILRGIEIPLAAPLIISGIRTAIVQVIATAPLAAFVAGGNLGRIILDGFKVRDFAQMSAGALLVALLAIAAEIVMAGVERLVTPRTQAKSEVRPPKELGQIRRPPEFVA